MDQNEELDPELQEIRQKRLQQLQGQHQGKQESSKRQEEQRKSVVSQLLTSEAADRLNRIALVKPEHAKLVENNLLMQYQQGRLREKVTEAQLKNMLSQLSGQTSKTTVQVWCTVMSVT